MKRVLLSCVILFCVVFASVLYINFPVVDRKAPARDGSLDLSRQPLGEFDRVKLGGEWEFYPGKLIEPGEEAFSIYQSIRQIVEVPGIWEKYFSLDSNRFGAGTYRLVVRVPEEGNYGVYSESIRTASRIYLNGMLASSSGVPAEQREDAIPGDKFHLAIGQSRDNVMEIVIHVSNESYFGGGFTYSPDFGTDEAMLNLRDKNRFLESFVISGYLILGVFSLLLFLRRKDLTYALYFGLYCLLLGLYFSTLNERLLGMFFADPPIRYLWRTQLSLFSLITACFLMFVYSFFRNVADWKIVRGCLILLLACAFFYRAGISRLLLGLNISPYGVQILAVLLSLGPYLYIGQIMWRAIRNGVENSEYVIFIVSTFLCYGLVLGLNFLFFLHLGQVVLFLFIGLAFTLTLMMASRFQQSYEQVNQLSTQLLEHDQMKNHVLAKAAREFVAPLEIMKENSLSLLEGRYGPLNLQQQESVLRMVGEGKRLYSLITDLFNAAEPFGKRLELALKPVDIHILQEVLDEIEYLLPTGKALKLVNRIPESFPLVYADETRLCQIVYNLLHNAVKYTEEGEIVLSARVQGELAQISVCDTGIGIEKSKWEMIFTTFYQDKNMMMGGSTGMGLGLGMAKKLVELQGGTIWLVSEPGQGSQFTFTVPLADPPQYPQSAVQPAEVAEEERKMASWMGDESHAAKAPGCQELIVVANPAPSGGKDLIDLITQLGYGVKEGEMPQQILELVEQEPVSLVIVDLSRAYLAGSKICRALRKQYSMVDLPILALTAPGQTKEMLFSMEAGANDFLRKPVRGEELKPRIDFLLAMKKSAEEAVRRELDYLHAQITPHFLYNTINTIIGLSYVDEEQTRAALHHLSTYFRAKLDFDHQPVLVPLEGEIELLMAYLAIEKIRYGDRLHIEYEIDETVALMLPRLTLQPLVENAVRHGIAPKKTQGTIRITVKRQDEKKTCIVIADDGVGMSPELQKQLLSMENSRIGFSNVLRKLALVKKAELTLNSEAGKGTAITILLPGGK